VPRRASESANDYNTIRCGDILSKISLNRSSSDSPYPFRAAGSVSVRRLAEVLSSVSADAAVMRNRDLRQRAVVEQLEDDLASFPEREGPEQSVLDQCYQVAAQSSRHRWFLPPP